MSGAPYDPAARRDTPLALKLKERIAREGPIPVAGYMQACLQDPEYGYYVKQPAIGAKGGFVTAPEISQVFGELIGLWCVAVWQQMGSPNPFNLVEFGPGRGTLMRDALRAMRVRPEILSCLRVILIETSTTLRETQKAALAGSGVPVSWIGKLDSAEDPKLPAIVLANEFIDSQPIQQFVRTAEGWAVRTVGLDPYGALVFMAGPYCAEYVARDLEQRFPSAAPGDVCEVHSLEHEFVDALLNQPSKAAALLIDYGHPATQPGDTLQAIRAHRHEHPLTSPGEADLTAQVDFAQVAGGLSGAHTAIDGPITQAEFLGRLGIIERASKLMSANPARAAEIEAGVARLIAPTGMGSRFKVIGVRSSGLNTLPGF